MSEHHRRFRRSAIAILTAASAVVLAGCAQEPERTQTVVTTPEIIWPDGSPDTELESSPWVKAIRDYETAWALAENLHDFSITQLTDIMPDSLIESGYQSDLSKVRNAKNDILHYPPAHPGPLPLSPISITESPDSKSAEVIVCRASDGWEITRTKSHPAVDLDRARQAGYRLTRSDHGQIRLTTSWWSSTRCDASNIRFGYFSPAPIISKTLTEQDIVPPISKKITNKK